MDWDDIRSFLAIVRRRTLSAAAKDLGVTQSTMSRRLASIEAKTGARLLMRNSNGYEPTALGEALLDRAERMEAEAISAERIVHGRDVALTGTVRLTTVEMIATGVLPEAASQLHAVYPGITLDIISGPQSLSLTNREADIALRMAPFENRGLVTKKVAHVANALYASEDYLERHGYDLADPRHAVITVMDDQANCDEAMWLSERLPAARPAMKSNHRDVQLAAAMRGIGVACLPCFLADSRPGLLKVDANGPWRDVWLGVHPDLRNMPRIRAVIDILDRVFAAEKARFEGRGLELKQS